MRNGQNDMGGDAAPRPDAGPSFGPKAGAAGHMWDPLVRITHWAVAMAVLANGLINKSGGTAHIWIGWAVLGLLALRFAWGVWGPYEARFTSFLPNPLAALRHVRALAGKLTGLNLGGGALRDYPSHNPAGALMVYALWGGLAAVSITGLVMTGGASPVRLAEERAAVAAGDWSVLVQKGDDDGHDKDGDKEGDDAYEWAEDVHEVAANLVLILALIHVAGVALESRALGRNLVRPMLRKP